MDGVMMLPPDSDAGEDLHVVTKTVFVGGILIVVTGAVLQSQVGLSVGFALAGIGFVGIGAETGGARGVMSVLFGLIFVAMATMGP